MKTLIFLAFCVIFATSQYTRPDPLMAKLGSRVEMRITDSQVKFITRKLENGQEQNYHVDGPNKNHWVDSNGKKLPSTNFEFKAPGTIIIKKFENSDVGVYNYVPLVQTTYPPAHHIDIAIVGYDLQIWKWD